MILKSSTAALLVAASASVHALPTLEEQQPAQQQQQQQQRDVAAPNPANASISETAASGFEVVIVYATPTGGCPATPTQCASNQLAAGPGSSGSGSGSGSKSYPATNNYQKAGGAGNAGNSGPVKATATMSHSAPLATLQPAVHWSYDTKPAKNVVPIPPHKGSDLYYGVDSPEKEGHFGTIKYYFNSPSVNLDHCDHVKAVSYQATGGGGGGGDMTVQFGSREAYEYAVKTWSAQAGLVLLAHTPGCGDHATGERCYFDVAALDFEAAGLRCVARGSPQHPDDLISKGETEWGWWTPRDGGVYATVAPTASTTGGPGGGGGARPTSTPGSFSWDASSASRTASASYPSGSVYPGGGSGGSGSGGSGSGSSGSGSGSGNNGSGSGGSGSGGSLYPPYGGNGATNSTGPFSGSNSTGTQDIDFTQPRVVCKAPVDTKYGLPTACESELFDQDLDDYLGYIAMPGSYSTFLKEVAPIPELDGSAPEVQMLRARALALRRRNWLTSGLKAVGNAINDHIIKPTVNAYNSAREATSIPGSVNKEVSWKLPDPANANPEAKTLKDPNAKQVVSPWGDAVLLKAFGSQESDESKKLNGYMNVFCVSCGVSGNAKIAGRAAWSPLSPGVFTKGEVEINTDAQFIFKLGIDAQMTYQQKFENALLDFGIPGLSYGVVSIGPRITVGTNVELEAQAKGRLLAGAEMGLQNAHVLIDFVNPSKSSKDGWEPYFKPVFEAEGELMLSAGLGLPIGIKCGLKISSWDKSVGIIDEPSIKGVAQVAASVGLDAQNKFAAGFKETNGCTGISTQLTWRNRLYIDILGISQSVLHDTQDKPLAQGCIKLPGLPAPSGTKTATTIATTPTGVSTGADGATTTAPAGSDATPATTTTPTTTPAGDAEATPAPAGNGSEPTDPSTGSDGSEPTSPSTGPDGSESTDPESSGNDQQESQDGQDAPTEQQPEPEQEPEQDQNQEQDQEQDQSEPAEQTEGDANNDEDNVVEKRDYPFELSERDMINATTMGSVIDLTSKVIGASNGSAPSSTLSYTAGAVGNTPYNATSGLEYSLLVTPDAKTMVVSCGNGNLYAFSVDGDENPNCSEMWAEYDDVLVADGAYRLLHYYNNTMARLGVSRLRVDDEAALPDHAVVVAFLPYSFLDDGSSSGEEGGDAAAAKTTEVRRRRRQEEVAEDDAASTTSSTDSAATDSTTDSTSTTSTDATAPTAPADDDFSPDDVYFAVDPAYELFYPVVCNYADAGQGPKLFLARDPEEGPKILASADVEFSITGGRVTECFAVNLMQGRWADDAGYSSASDINDKAAADLLDFDDGYDVDTDEE